MVGLSYIVISGLYSHLPVNGSELVLFDVNRYNDALTPSIAATASSDSEVTGKFNAAFCLSAVCVFSD